jgi:hypothetical protein
MTMSDTGCQCGCADKAEKDRAETCECGSGPQKAK